MDATHSRKISVPGGHLALKRRGVNVPGREGRQCELKVRGGLSRDLAASLLLQGVGQTSGTFLGSFPIFKMGLAVPPSQGGREARKGWRATRHCLHPGPLRQRDVSLPKQRSRGVGDFLPTGMQILMWASDFCKNKTVRERRE